MEIMVNQLNIHYEVTGKGRPLLMIHGNAEDHHIFDELAFSLKDHYQIYQIDSRCHGKSDCALPLTYEQMADDMMKFIQYLNLDDLSILGFSDGGIIAILIALEKPIWIKKIYVCGANLSITGFFKKDLQELTKALENQPNMYIELMIKQKRIDQKKLDQLDIEAYVFAGEKDLIPLRHTKMIQRHLKHSKLFIMPNRTHDNYIVHSDELKDYFLEK